MGEHPSMAIELPFPSSELAGHNTGHGTKKSGPIAAHRLIARVETKRLGAHVLTDGDIRLRIDFYRPDKRGDRINFPNRMKPYFDGIAEGLGVNDSRFVPEYHFHDGVKPGKVVVSL